MSSPPAQLFERSKSTAEIQFPEFIPPQKPDARTVPSLASIRGAAGAAAMYDSSTAAASHNGQCQHHASSCYQSTPTLSFEQRMMEMSVATSTQAAARQLLQTSPQAVYASFAGPGTVAHVTMNAFDYDAVENDAPLQHSNPNSFCDEPPTPPSNPLSLSSGIAARRRPIIRAGHTEPLAPKPLSQVCLPAAHILDEQSNGSTSTASSPSSLASATLRCEAGQLNAGALSLEAASKLQVEDASPHSPPAVGSTPVPGNPNHVTAPQTPQTTTKHNNIHGNPLLAPSTMQNRCQSAIPITYMAAKSHRSEGRTPLGVANFIRSTLPSDPRVRRQEDFLIQRLVLVVDHLSAQVFSLNEKIRVLGSLARNNEASLYTSSASSGVEEKSVDAIGDCVAVKSITHSSSIRSLTHALVREVLVRLSLWLAKGRRLLSSTPTSTEVVSGRCAVGVNHATRREKHFLRGALLLLGFWSMLA